MLPQFPLFPMDENRENAPVARAHALSIDGQWLLRAFNGWTWAREVANPTPERTWILPLDLPPELDVPLHVPNTGSSPEYGVPDAELLSLWFAMHGDKTQLWRAMWFYDGRSSNRTYTLFFGPNGEGVLREAWNRDDISFRWTWPDGDTENAVSSGDFEEFRALAKDVFFEQLWDKLNNWSKNKERARRTYLHVETEFLCGSQSELERLLCLIAWHDPVLSASGSPIEISVQAENAYSRAEVRAIEAGDLRCWHRRNWEVNADDAPPSFVWSGKPPPGVPELIELALDENTPVGMNWEYSDNFSGRVSHTPEAPSLEFEFEPPTHHERLEAHLQLREWLQSRVSRDELKRLLGE